MLTQTTTINLTGVAVRPVVDALKGRDGKRFLVLELGLDTRIILPGFDRDAVEFMQKLAQAVDNAGLDLAATLDAEASEAREAVAGV